MRGISMGELPCWHWAQSCRNYERWCGIYLGGEEAAGIYLPTPITHWLRAALRDTESPALVACPCGLGEVLQILEKLAVGSHPGYRVATAAGLR